MQDILKNKRILLCVSGSIAVYKALELLRLYVKHGADVQVLLSEGAKRFVSELSFEALSNNKVLHEKSESWANNYNHIKISKKVDAVVFAPATANSINKLANGVADTLLTQTLLANKKPLLLAPAMNTNMLTHKATQKSLKTLKKRGVQIVSPVSKLLACKDTGNGALAEVEDVFFHTLRLIYKEKFWSKKSVLVTGGGTREKLDDVRFIGNFSSGKMAYNLALALFIKGASVTLLTSRPTRAPFSMESFSDSKELKAKLLSFDGDFLFMAAAVGDYKLKKPKKGKLKKEKLGKIWKLKLHQNEDLLKSLAYKSYKRIGFKAEFDVKKAKKNAKKALKNKKLDGICLNILGQDVNFGSTKTRMSFISKNKTKNFKLQSKFKTALKLVNGAKKI